MALSRDPLDDLIVELDRALPLPTAGVPLPPELDFVRLQFELAEILTPWLPDRDTAPGDVEDEG